VELEHEKWTELISGGVQEVSVVFLADGSEEQPGQKGPGGGDIREEREEMGNRRLRLLKDEGREDKILI